MNLTLHFEDDIGRVVCEVTLWQVPTISTNKILAAKGKEKVAYFDWVTKLNRRLLAARGAEHIARVEEIFEIYTPDYIPVWGML